MPSSDNLTIHSWVASFEYPVIKRTLYHAFGIKVREKRPRNGAEEPFNYGDKMRVKTGNKQ
jgi:hypothetical protein